MVEEGRGGNAVVVCGKVWRVDEDGARGGGVVSWVVRVGRVEGRVVLTSRLHHTAQSSSWH